ncbi:hypothetical protein V8C86DRAFT_2518536 [Haematococcus lacustris]
MRCAVESAHSKVLRTVVVCCLLGLVPIAASHSLQRSLRTAVWLSGLNDVPTSTQQQLTYPSFISFMARMLRGDVKPTVSIIIYGSPSPCTQLVEGLYHVLEGMGVAAALSPQTSSPDSLECRRLSKGTLLLAYFKTREVAAAAMAGLQTGGIAQFVVAAGVPCAANISAMDRASLDVVHRYSCGGDPPCQTSQLSKYAGASPVLSLSELCCAASDADTSSKPSVEQSSSSSSGLAMGGSSLGTGKALPGLLMKHIIS